MIGVGVVEVLWLAVQEALVQVVIVTVSSCIVAYLVFNLDDDRGANNG